MNRVFAFLTLVFVLLNVGCSTGNPADKSVGKHKITAQIDCVVVRNDSKERIWVDKIEYGKRDFRCGILKPKAEATTTLAATEFSHKTASVVWWVGKRNRLDEDPVFSSEVKIPELVNPTSSHLRLLFSLDEKNQWTVNIDERDVK